METTYDQLRIDENLVNPIIKYYKSKLKPGDNLWWIDNNTSNSHNNLIIRIWNNLSVQEKFRIKIQALVYFPELFGNRNDKFGKLAIWLIMRNSIVCPNLRDIFTAGGKGDFVVDKQLFSQIPRMFLNVFENIDALKKILATTEVSVLSEFWGIETSESTKVFDWISLVDNNWKKSPQSNFLDIKKILLDLF